MKKIVGQALRVVHDMTNPKTTPTEVLHDLMDQVTIDGAEPVKSIEPIDLDAGTVYSLLDNIADEDIALFNMNVAHCRPKDLMITSIPVPPSCLRPTVQMMHGMRNEDDLTAKMSEIIVRNNELERVINEGEDPTRVMTDWYNLQCSVAQYFNSDVPGLPFEMSK